MNSKKSTPSLASSPTSQKKRGPVFQPKPPSIKKNPLVSGTLGYGDTKDLPLDPAESSLIPPGEAYDISSEPTMIEPERSEPNEIKTPSKRLGPAHGKRPSKSRTFTFTNKITGLFRQKKYANLLKELNVFKNLSPEALKHLAQHVQEEHYNRGTYIIQQGELGDSMYILVDGEVEVSKKDKEDGEQRVFRFNMGAGEIFGEMALLIGEPRTANVIALSDCYCLTLRKETLERTIKEYPEIARILTAIVGERLVRAGSIQTVGKYRLINYLGRGGMSIVYEGIHPTLQRSVAVKMLSHELVYQGNFASLFRKEAQIMARLRHPHIIEVFDTEEAYATFFIVMEKLPGIDLNKVIKQKKRIPYPEARKILIQVASALESAHSHGIVHRDIKPSNIMFTNNGNVKISDFGISLAHKTTNTKPGAILDETQIVPSMHGTPAYMAPEQILQQKLDHRIDIYALGIVAYKMLVGINPFVGNISQLFQKHLETPLPKIREYIPEVPEDLEQFIYKAAAKEPSERFQNASEILEFFGAKSTSVELSELSLETLTLLYKKEQANAVQELVAEFKQKLSQLPDVRVSHAEDKS